MMVYIGSDIPLSIQPYKGDNPAFHTEKLSENDATLLKHFSTEYVSYAGSSEGCGCGFQHALIDNNEDWLNVIDEETQDYQRNMQELRDYIERVLEKAGKVELYACWDGEVEDSPRAKETITSGQLTSGDFYLKEKGFYTIK